MAQISKVTGVITSADDGQPVIGASVLIKDTGIGTVTDIDGKFVLSNIPSNAKKIQISYVGMKPQEVSIKSNLIIVLESDSEMIDEVIIKVIELVNNGIRLKDIAIISPINNTILDYQIKNVLNRNEIKVFNTKKNNK